MQSGRNELFARPGFAAHQTPSRRDDLRGELVS
jgi:hypothetical protein